MIQNQQLDVAKKDSNQQLIDNLFDRISREIDDLEITYDANKHFPQREKPEFVTFKGINVLYNLKSLYSIADNTVLNQLNLIMISFEHLFKLTSESKYKWQMQLQMNQDRNYLLFYTKIIWPLNVFYNEEWDKLITKRNPPHPDSLGTRARFEKLLKESYTYLLKRELVGMPVDEVYKKLINPKAE